jgi:all-trans-retinol dehydrogenase (NAD+)
LQRQRAAACAAPSRLRQVNTISHFWTLKAFLPHMIQANSGHIVTVASIAGHVGVPGLLDYCASKFGAVGIDNALRFELYDAAPGVRTLCVCPHFISTGMFAGASAGRFPWLVPTLTPAYVAERVVRSIIAGDAVLFMPRFVKLVPLLKGVFSVRLQYLIMRFFGFTHSMDTFVGHASPK